MPNQPRSAARAPTAVAVPTTGAAATAPLAAPTTVSSRLNRLMMFEVFSSGLSPSASAAISLASSQRRATAVSTAFKTALPSTSRAGPGMFSTALRCRYVLILDMLAFRRPHDNRTVTGQSVPTTRNRRAPDDGQTEL